VHLQVIVLRLTPTVLAPEIHATIVHVLVDSHVVPFEGLHYSTTTDTK